MTTKIYIILKCEMLADQCETDTTKSIWFVSPNQQECLNALDKYAKTHKIEDIYNWTNNREIKEDFLLWEMYECNQHLIKKILQNFGD